ncbi:MAG: sigma 54-interacting transcriptional regulator [Firmicutes bacterium]|nr:sigma 54-interacting transcriptional regulator [Bacillota bacterium]
MQDILIDNSDNKLSKELEEILEGSFDGILVTDKDTNVLYVNKSYERVAEIPLSDLVGHSMKELYNPVWMPTSVASIVVKEKKPVSKRQVVKSGRHIMVTGRPVFDEDGEVKKVVINARDISEIYDLREELLETRAVTKMYTDRFDYDDADFIEKEGGLVAVSKQMRQIISLAEKIAPFQATVLILGESGVGKEEVAKFIHKHSTRSDKPFIPINCGAIPHDLLESELFGYERGAFTGAMNTGKEGLIEAAEGGTIFLDEIGETTLDFQVKLLRFLETREIRKVGSTSSKTVDVRVIAATNKDIKIFFMLFFLSFLNVNT